MDPNLMNALQTLSQYIEDGPGDERQKKAMLAAFTVTGFLLGKFALMADNIERIARAREGLPVAPAVVPDGLGVTVGRDGDAP